MSAEDFSDDMDAIRQIFFDECDEQLALLEEELTTLGDEPENGEKINTIFRCVHSIKGGAAAFGMDDLVKFSHLFESVLDRFRSGACTVDADSIATFLKCKDALYDIVAAFKSGAQSYEVDPGTTAELEQYLHSDAPVVEPEPENVEMDDIFGLSFAPVKIEIDEPTEQQYSIVMTVSPQLYERGDDVRNILIALDGLGQCQVTVDIDPVPELGDISPCQSYLVWEILLSTAEPRASIDEIFEWSGDDVHAVITRLPDHAEAEAVAVPSSAPREEKPDPQVKNPVERKDSATVRVDIQRIDKLVDLIGELVINQGAIQSQMRRNKVLGDSILGNVVTAQEQLIHELQENVITMRAYPIKTVFQKLGRVVRETARLTGKQVRLVLEGEDTEVDRSILEKLSDPLTHMVRNAIDHGIEEAETRAQAGKDPEGLLRLRAFQRSGRIIVEIQDDGAGLDPDRIYKKAVEKKIIEQGQRLDREEIYSLIFEPGFSTVAEVTDVSGRGVGMDVVKQSLQQINGRIFISSAKGKGTTFSISLPFTLSVIEGIIFKAEGQDFVIPVNNVLETIIYDATKAFHIGEGKYGYPYRDGYLSVIYAAEILGSVPDGKSQKICFVIENENEEKTAFIVDKIIDHSRFVVKNLEENYRKISCFSTATILGDGNVAFILDVEFLFGELLKKRESLLEETV
ncbi:chemotaxis protein CheA [Gluconobacter roseus]|uniref:Chemotaxis protein CheA n=1 Tax=Gluconobacter roseus NBRC 3990 TaxID=1307950 RepID=A0A4Y3M3L3_9PROT|nr:chemotaxis protein CheA [Gluconobacter roseus]KXV44313.1 chemotaxis protein CheA [Gluconobacter roseus]GBR44599.1 chemotaxis protein CheA [Gluconobacter roseus NBRC 3990]GEB02676.1 chemotaxis protein CheA [Gluconobacter roseus NBRC 3990]GLP93135.1 chemotaxis protein CheA [Gluconobacter roseus NBRC 3990]